MTIFKKSLLCLQTSVPFYWAPSISLFPESGDGKVDKREMENLAGFPPVLSANYMSQEALAPRRVSTLPSTWRKLYSAWSDARGQSLPPCTLGWELRRIPPKMLQLQDRSKFIIVPRKGSSVILTRFSRTTGILQLRKPVLGL